MMLSRLTKKTVVLFTVGVLFIAGAGVAFAYWTAGGAGTGTAATGTSADVTVNQTALANDLGPDVAAQTLSGTFGNSGETSVFITTVTVTIDSVTVNAASDGDANTVCDADDYVLTGEEMTVNQSVAVGDPMGTWTGATIAFVNDPNENQDECKGATVNLEYVAA